jgi:hypothetical protein
MTVPPIVRFLRIALLVVGGGRGFQDPRCRSTDRLLRQWPRAAVDAAAVAAGGAVPGAGRFHDVLAAHRLFHGGGVRKYHAIHHSWTCRSGPSGCRKAGCPIITGWTINRRFRPRSPANWPIRCGNRPGTRTVLRHPLSRTVRSWPRATMSGTGLTSGSVAGPIQRFVSATSMRSLNLALTYL